LSEFEHVPSSCWAFKFFFVLLCCSSECRLHIYLKWYLLLDCGQLMLPLGLAGFQ
jgi:hypothetical protein